MKKTMVALLAAVLLLVIGAVICGFSLVAIGFDPERLNTVEFNEGSVTVPGDFSDIRIRTNLQDVRLIPSGESACRMDFVDRKEAVHDIRIEDGTLIIETLDTGKWYHYIGFSTKSPLLTVYLPRDSYNSLQAELNTGSLSFSGIGFDGDIRLTSTTGDVTLTGVTCRDLVSESNTGDLDLSDVIASGNMDLSRNTGDIHLEDSDAAGLTVNTNTGDVTGTLLTGKQFIAKSSTGDIDIPGDTEGGRFEVTTVSGDIDLQIRGN